jgi:pimeloyl-ACP methyl ester carboxylesterase
MAYDLGEPARAERLVTAKDGLSLYVRDYAPITPSHGLPVLCLHGLTRNSRDFELVAPRIASLGRRVLAPDMRGRGASARDANPDHYAPAVYVGDVVTMLDALGIKQVAIVGTSMGGIIAMLMAAMAPGRIAATVLNDVGPVLEESGLKRIASYVGKAMEFATWDEAIAAVRASQATAFPKADDAFWARFARRVCRQTAGGKIAYDYDPQIARPFANTAAPDMTPLFEALSKAPVLTVRGALSDLLSDEGIALMRIVAPDMPAAIVPDVGHAPTLEEPAAWDAIVDFLAKVD